MRGLDNNKFIKYGRKRLFILKEWFFNKKEGLIPCSRAVGNFVHHKTFVILGKESYIKINDFITKEVMSLIFGYVRVSAKDQNPARQIKILIDMGIEERNIYLEKESGRKFERPVYRSLVDNILREGDLLVVTELKRFGRNYSEIYKEWFHITKEIGADIKVTSMPILDTTQSKELVGQLITDVVLAVFAYVADEDWTERHELQRQGIEVAKASGKHLGRPRVEYPENWEDCYGRWKSGVISAKEAMTLTGLKKDSFYRLVKKYESELKGAEEEK